jgi:RNA polymerase sigma-54 factor
MISQKQELQLQQRLSPRQILLMRLLQIPVIALKQRIEQELEENPALELTDEDTNREDEETVLDTNEETEYDSVADTETETDNPIEEFNEEPINLYDYFEDDDTGNEYSPSLSNNINKDEDTPNRNERYISNESFQESLVAQLGMFDLSKEDAKITTFLIGNIDESGYLSHTEENMMNYLLFNTNTVTTAEHIKELIVQVIQKFDPPGIGARDLRECLLLQLQRMGTNTEDCILAKKIVEKYFSEFTKKHFDRIKRGLLCSDEQFSAAIACLLKLNPKPGSSFSSDNDTHGIVPDFIIRVNDKTQQLELSLQRMYLPELRVGKRYQRLYKDLQQKKAISQVERKEAILFVRQKVNAAKWFIEALTQREQTLYRTMYAIMNYQKDFFHTGDEMVLKPMVSKDIATEIGIDISTVSRVVRLKHVLTPYGVYPLKFFFSESMTKNTGEEVSSREIKKIISDTVKDEDKNLPLTDLVLCTMLNEKGYNIARRTVAKYREQLGIPVARLRK